MAVKSNSFEHREKNKCRSRKVYRIIGTFLILLVFGLVICIKYPSIPVRLALKIDQITGCERYCLSDRAEEIFIGIPYSPEAIGVFDMNTGEPTQYIYIDESVTPASLMKLFTVYFVSKHFDLNEVVEVEDRSLRLVPPKSSLAHLKPGHFTVEQLYQAMLIPSGNDAAMALAVAYGQKKYGSEINPKQALEKFLEDANKYLQANGYIHTTITDPAGYNSTNKTTVSELAKVSLELLKELWFNNIVDKSTIVTITPDQVSYAWKTTNQFLNPQSEWYDPNVKGVKTGSLADWTNLEVLYKNANRSYLIISIGTATDKQRYTTVKRLIEEINNN